MKPSNPSRVLTLERGLQILEYIVERRNVTVTNVATAFGIQKSASHRFLNTLKYMGYVEQTPQSDYALTGRLRYLAEGVVPRIDLGLPVPDGAIAGGEFKGVGRHGGDVGMGTDIVGDGGSVDAEVHGKGSFRMVSE